MRGITLLTLLFLLCHRATAQFKNPPPQKTQTASSNAKTGHGSINGISSSASNSIAGIASANAGTANSNEGTIGGGYTIASSPDYSQNEVHLFGSEMNIEWAKALENYKLVLFQQNTDFQQTIKNISNETFYDWTVNTQANLDDGQVFWFRMQSNANKSDSFACEYFNITKGGTTTLSPSTTGTPASTPTSSSTSVSTTALGLADDNNDIDNKSSSSELSEQAKVGIGVGVGLGCAFIIAIVGMIWFFRRAVVASVAKGIGAGMATAHPPPMADASVSYKPDYAAIPPYQQALQPVIIEVPGDRGVELPAESVVRHELP